MNIPLSAAMCAAGMASGWFIPLAASKIAAYKLNKRGQTLRADPRFTSLPLKLVCLFVNGALWAAVGLFNGNLLQGVLLALILLDAEIITVIDLRIHLIPNEAVLLMLLAGLLLQLGFNGISSFITAVISAVILMLAFIALGSVLGLHTIGAGDVKLAGAMGLMLGYPYIMYGMIGMSLILLVWCCGGLITRKLNLKSMLAFAPFMMAGTVFAIVANISGH